MEASSNSQTSNQNEALPSTKNSMILTQKKLSFKAFKIPVASTSKAKADGGKQASEPKAVKEKGN